MAITALTMPKLGLTMKEGKVTAWEAPLGAAVNAGDPLFDVETTKINTVCEAPKTGVLRRQVAAVGTVLPVGALVGVIADQTDAETDIDRFVNGFHPQVQA